MISMLMMHINQCLVAEFCKPSTPFPPEVSPAVYVGLKMCYKESARKGGRCSQQPVIAHSNVKTQRGVNSTFYQDPKPQSQTFDVGFP